ncbi:MAG: type II toxin-antitoxin system YafQ family toxin [Kiritimatiellaeota bacterium]|nr:type II toxin-antitoxin system YafQ family toxin [Kiritimatiellota bacterium]
MKKYHFTKRFEKQYAKLPSAKQDAVDAALLLYLEKPDAPKLRRHALKGEYAGQTSISAGGDVRIHLIEDDNIIIVVVCVGSHSQLYK